MNLDDLEDFRAQLSRDQPIAELEKVEDRLKRRLAEIFAAGVDGGVARAIARFQRELGFLLKYKSYAVKATTPLGYSVFLQAPGEGFSFQRHLTHKIELFHVLGASPGAFIFLCGFEDWKRAYEPASFQRWLDGEPNAALEAFRYPASPGQVFPITDLGTIHTAFGCVLEEFATVSTDMVDRLHDQNVGRAIPERFTRAFSEEHLRVAPWPGASRIVAPGNRNGTPIAPREIRGGREVVLHDSTLRAARYELDAGVESAHLQDPARATVLRVFGGTGEVVIADDRELGQGKTPGIRFAAGELFMIPPGITYWFRPDAPVQCAEHRVAPDQAFV